MSSHPSQPHSQPFSPARPPWPTHFRKARLRRSASPASGCSASRSVLKADVEKGRLPGAVVAIARKGQLAYFETVGFLDAARKVEMPRDAIFSLASMSKPMTSIAIMMLIEEGRLFLSDPVAKYLPAMADMKVGVVKTDAQGKATVETEPAKRQPTIQDLLRHTSGLTYGGRGETPVHKLWPAGSAVAAVNYTGPELIAHIGKLPLLYQPGTVWDYSLSVDVLGLVVEAITGQSLGAFLQERLWGPLGMVDTSFAIPDNKKGRYALAFPNDPLTGKAQTVLHAGKPIKFDCGGACAAGTAIDYLRFGADAHQRRRARRQAHRLARHARDDDVRPARSRHPRAHDEHGSQGEGYTFGLGFAIRQETGHPPSPAARATTPGAAPTAPISGSTRRKSWSPSSCRPRPAKSASTTARCIRSLVLQAIAD